MTSNIIPFKKLLIILPEYWLRIRNSNNSEIIIKFKFLRYVQSTHHWGLFRLCSNKHVLVQENDRQEILSDRTHTNFDRFLHIPWSKVASMICILSIVSKYFLEIIWGTLFPLMDHIKDVPCVFKHHINLPSRLK